MMSYIPDEFDRFCEIARNPTNNDNYRAQLTIEDDVINDSSSNTKAANNLYRSRSVRMTSSPRNNTNRYTQHQQQQQQQTTGVNCSLDKDEVSKIVRVRSFRRTNNKGGVVCNKDMLELSNNERDEHAILIRAGDRGARSVCASRSGSFKVDPSSHRASITTPRQQSTANDIVPGQVTLEVSHEYTVQVLGLEGVGKSSLVEHLLVPEDLEFQYEEHDPDQINRSIRIMVDDKESVLHLVDCDASHLSSAETYTNVPDAYLIMYAVDDKQSFEACRKLLANVVLTNQNAPVVILIGNKADLVRTRVVSLDEGKRLAAVYNLKFKEISTSLNHCVDELLVSLVTQIRTRYSHHSDGYSSHHQASSCYHNNQPSTPGTSSPHTSHHNTHHQDKSSQSSSNNKNRTGVLRRLHNAEIRFSNFFNRHRHKSTDHATDHG